MNKEDPKRGETDGQTVREDRDRDRDRDRDNKRKRRRTIKTFFLLFRTAVDSVDCACLRKVCAQGGVIVELVGQRSNVDGSGSVVCG